MSSYNLPTTDGLEAVVGWDPPLNTFFAQVWDRRLDEDDPAAELLWVGCSFAEVGDVDKVRDAVAPWAQVPEDVMRSLYADAHQHEAVATDV